MRLPFLQMESDLIAHGAAEVAALAGCSVPQALGHIAMVRAWVVSHATDEAPPDGMVQGDAAGRRIEAAAQWTGERGALLQALTDAGQVRAEGVGIRVLHLEPYVKAWEQNAKAKERMRIAREESAKRRASEAARSANIAVTDAERSATFDGQTQTQTQMEEGKPPPSAFANGVVGPPEPFALAVQDATPKPAPEPKEPTPSAAQKLYEGLEDERRKQCERAGVPFVPMRWDVKRINTAFRDVVKVPKGAKLDADGFTEEQNRFYAAFMEFIADPDGEKREPAWSLGWFMNGGVRSRYEGRALKAGAA